MYKTKTLLLVLVTLPAITAFSQNNPGNYKNQVKVSPLRIIDPVHSGIELSYERRHSSNYAAQLSAAYFIPGIFNGEYKNYEGYRVGIEEKYFFPRRVRHIYLSAEAIYQKNSFHTIASFIHSTGPAPFQYIDSIKINRRAAILNFKTGRQFMIRRFVADASIGVGVRFRKVIHEGKLYTGDEMPGPRHPNIHYEANREKKDAAFNLPITVRIGYMF